MNADLQKSTVFATKGSIFVAPEKRPEPSGRATEAREKFGFTKKLLDKLPSPTGTQRKYFYDSTTRGLAIAVSPKGKKVFVLYRKVAGRPKRYTIGPYPDLTIEQARGKAAEWNGAIARGEDPATKKRIERTTTPTFSQLLEAYIDRHLRVEANRPESAEYQLRMRLTKVEWMDRPIDKISIADVIATKNEILTNAKRSKYARSGGGYQANRLIQSVRLLYNWAGRSKNGKVNFFPVAFNPAKDIELCEETPRKRFLQPEELVRVEKELKEETCADLKDFITLALSTGARKDNILSAKWEDVHFVLNSWHIPETKSGEPYDIELTPSAFAVFERRRKRLPEQEVFVFPAKSKSGHSTGLKKEWQAFRIRAKIPDVRIHDLRRTHGSYMAISGASLQKIGAALGHAEGSTATKVYSHLHQSAVTEARLAAEKKMQQMMATAKRRAKLTAKHPAGLLGGGNGQ